MKVALPVEASICVLARKCGDGGRGGVPRRKLVRMGDGGMAIVIDG